MAYKIQSSEKTTASGAEHETKALLYLMSISKEDKIYYFVIDFFNDLTGVDRYSDKLWDIQSKGNKNTSPKQIGRELVTLLKNYLSEIDFSAYILFIGGVSNTVRKNNNENVFTIANIQESAIAKIKEGLFEESSSKEYIEKSRVNEKVIDKFLKEVCFVVDNLSKSDYIKNIIKVNPLIIPEDIVLEQIFDQIRDVQSSKKNNGNVEGIIINSTEDFLFYNRHLTINEIKMLVLNRLINHNIMDKGIPTSFYEIYGRLPDVKRKDMIEDCKLSIARMLFDKNNADNFWDFFNNIYDVLCNNPSLSLDEQYKKLNREILSKINCLDILSVRYFMSIVKDGIYE